MSAPRLLSRAALAALLACAATAAVGQWDPQRIQSAYKGATVFIEAEHDSLFQPLGTGVVVSKEGHVLTAKHIFRCGDCERAKFWGRIGDRKAEPRIPLQLGTEAAGSIDAALIRLAAPIALLKPPPVAVPKANPGWDLFVLGFPHQVPFSVGVGILSSLDEGGQWRTTLPLSPGYSGAPVFDRSGSLVAIAVGGARGLEDMKTVLPLSVIGALLKEANIALDDGARRVKVFIDADVLGEDSERARRVRRTLGSIGSQLQHIELTDSRPQAEFALTNLVLARYLDKGLEVHGTMVRPDGTEVRESGKCFNCVDDPDGAVQALSEFLNRTLLHYERGPYRLINIDACRPEGDLWAMDLSWLKGGAGLEDRLLYEVGDWRPGSAPGMTGLFVHVYEKRAMAPDSAKAIFQQVQEARYRPKACIGEQGKDVLMLRAGQRRTFESTRHADFRVIAR